MPQLISPRIAAVPEARSGLHLETGVLHRVWVILVRFLAAPPPPHQPG